jgi:adenosylmethionine---8-amino-7-oxononanoate aminotransferase
MKKSSRKSSKRKVAFIAAWRSQLEDDDRRHLWHPFTQMLEWEKETPLIIEKGKGIYLWDLSNKKYLDGTSSIWVNLHGHRQARIDRAIMAQAKKISHSTLLGLSNIPAIRLARKLVEIAPKGLTKVFYSDNGSTAVEVALKMAFQYWQQKGIQHKKKTKYVSLVNAYHGDTLGAVGVGGIELFHKLYQPLLFPSYRPPSPYCYRCHLGLTFPSCRTACLEEVENILRDHQEELAALVVEPMIQAAAGILVFPSGYLRRLREACTRYRVLMICDEVATGFGRTGKMFASDHEGVTPDLMAVAKGLTGGYLPLGATLTTQEVYNAFLGKYEEFKTFFHGHSYTGNQLGCAAALASLKLFEQRKILKKLPVKVKYLSHLLIPFKSMHHVGNVRQMGMIVGIELVKNKNLKTPYPIEERLGMKVALEARNRGLLLRPLGNVVVLMPPLSITKKELKLMVGILYDSIAAVTGAAG